MILLLKLLLPSRLQFLSCSFLSFSYHFFAQSQVAWLLLLSYVLYDDDHHFLGSFAERERERLEEKKQRESEKTTSKTEEAEVKEEEKQESTTLPSPAINEVEPAKELKIEVHATAVHHEQIQPIVAHAQSHEISHEHAVSFRDFIRITI